jgi:hypothetical protein
MEVFSLCPDCPLILYRCETNKKRLTIKMMQEKSAVITKIVAFVLFAKKKILNCSAFGFSVA